MNRLKFCAPIICYVVLIALLMYIPYTLLTAAGRLVEETCVMTKYVIVDSYGDIAMMYECETVPEALR